jgi:hypothetical protein
MQLYWKIAKLLSIAHTLGYDNYVEIDSNLCTISIKTNEYPETNGGYQKVRFNADGLELYSEYSDSVHYEHLNYLLEQLEGALKEYEYKKSLKERKQAIINKLTPEEREILGV